MERCGGGKTEWSGGRVELNEVVARESHRVERGMTLGMERGAVRVNGYGAGMEQDETALRRRRRRRSGA